MGKAKLTKNTTDNKDRIKCTKHLATPCPKSCLCCFDLENMSCVNERTGCSGNFFLLILSDTVNYLRFVVCCTAKIETSHRQYKLHVKDY